MLLMRRACPLPEANNLQQKNLCQPLCAKGQITVQKSKTTIGKIFFFNAKNGKQQISFFVVEVLVLQKYKSKNNNDFLENAFIMSFSVFTNAFFVQFGCIKQNVHVAFASAVSLDIAHVVC